MFRHGILVPAWFYLASGVAAVFLWRGGAWQYAVLGTVIPVAAFALLDIAWQRLKYYADPYLLPVVAMLSYTSLVFLYRLNPAYAFRQFVWLLAGLACLFVTTTIFLNPRRLSEYKYIYVLAGAVALVLPIFFGREQGGARSWLDLGLFSLQPAEFVKIMIVLFLASFMAENKILLVRGTRRLLGLPLPSIKDWGPLLVMWGISLLLLVFQRDLGTALIYFGTFLAMIYMATARLSFVALGLGLFLASSVISYMALDHVRQRVDIWLLNPGKFMELGDAAYNQAYQVIQSLFALGSGGIIGAGLGAGQPGFIPAVHTDFIFAAIVEETGLLGGTGIILLYIVFIYRGFKIAMTAGSDFSRLLAAGLTSLMGLQAFIILAGVTKMLPLTGVTLPYVSYGGSSLVANFIILGLLLNISREAFVYEQKH